MSKNIRFASKNASYAPSRRLQRACDFTNDFMGHLQGFSSDAPSALTSVQARTARVLMDSFGSGLTQIQKDHLQNASMAADPVVMNTISNGVLEEAKMKVKLSSSQPRIRIKQHLGVAEQDELIKLFPNFDLRFDLKPQKHSHAFAAAHRTCALRELVRMAHLDPCLKPDAQYHHPIKFVGGNPAHHIYGNYSCCHTCAPVLDANDALRNAKFQEALSNGSLDRVHGMRHVLRSLRSGEDFYMCHNRSQYCYYKAPVLISLHSIYDCDVESIVGMMEAASAEVMYGCMIFDATCLIRDEGYVKSQKSYFRKYKENGTRYIEFSFKDDTQNHYIHKEKNYLTIPTRSVFTSGNSIFQVERKYDSGVIFFAVRRLRCLYVPRTKIVFSYPEVDDYYVLYTAMKNAGGVGRMVKHRLVISKKLWDTTYNYALSLDEQKFRFRRILCAITSFNTRAINMGEGFVQQQLADPMVLCTIAHAVFVLVYVENFCVTQSEKNVRETLDKQRSGKISAWSKLKCLFKKLTWRQMMPFVSHDHFDYVEKLDESQIVGHKCRDCHSFGEAAKEYELRKIVPNLAEVPAIFTIQEDVGGRYCQLPGKMNEFYKECVEDDDFNNLSMPEIIKCRESLEVARVAGDGDCLIHALNTSGLGLGDPYNMRMKYAELSTSEEQKKRFTALRGTEDSYLEMDDISLIASHEKVTICVHTSDYCARLGNGIKVYHIQYYSGHYDALLEKVVMPECHMEIFQNDRDCQDFKNLRDEVIDTITWSQWKVGRNAADMYSGLERGGYVSRSGLKLAEMVERKLINAKVPLALDLGGGPGGFAQVLLERGVGTLVGVTKRITYDNPMDYPYEKFLDNYKNFYHACADGELDLTNDTSRNVLIKELKRAYGGSFDLVVGDCSVGSDERKDGSDEKLHINLKLLESEVILVEQLMIDGGSSILKLSEPDRLETAELVVRLANHFGQTTMVKPLTSRGASREVYVVFKDYGTDRDFTISNYFYCYKPFHEEEIRQLRRLRQCALTAKSRSPISYDDFEHIPMMRKALSLKTTVISGGGYGKFKYVPLVNSSESMKTACSNSTLESYITTPSSEDRFLDVERFELQSIEPKYIKVEKEFDATCNIEPVVKKFKKKFKNFVHLSKLTCRGPKPEQVAKILNYKNHLVFQKPQERDEIAVECGMKSDVVAPEIESNLDARGEYVKYLEYLLKSRLEEHKVMWETAKAVPSDRREKILEAYSKNAKFVEYKVDRGNYLYCYDGIKFIRYDKSHGTVLVSEDTELMTDIDILESIKSYSGDRNLCDISFVQAAPGCGKTTFLVNSYRDGDTLLVSTREGKDDVTFRLQQRKISGRVKTIHSFLMNPFESRRLLIDEALMQHAGMIMFSLDYSKCEEAIIVGDVNQIPFVNRCPDFGEMKHSKLTGLLKPCETLNVSYRVPADVVVRFSKDYGDVGFKTTNHIVDSCDVVPITSISDVPMNKKKKYLTFTQYEKTSLREHGYDVSTVNEFQGKQCENVAVVRLTPANHVVRIFSERAYILVAMTRHTKSFVYYTVHPGDAMSQIVNKKPGYAECRNVSKMVGGGVLIPRDAVPVRTLKTVPASATDFCVQKPVRVNVVLKAADEGRVIRFCPGIDLSPYLKALEQSDRARVAWIPNSISTCTDKYLAINTVDEFTGMVEEKEELPSEVLTNVVGDFEGVEIDLNLLQNFVQAVYPNSSFVRMVEDAWMVERTALDSNYKGIKIKPQKGFYTEPSYGTMLPILDTPMPAKRFETTVEILLALSKRNLAVPKMVLTLPLISVSRRMVDRFFEAYLDGDPVKLFESYNVGNFKEWLDSQEPVVDKTLEEMDVRSQIRDKYSFIIKPTPKPKLDDGASEVYSALQTVMYQDKAINAYFCPIFREMKKALFGSLKKNVLIYSDMSPNDFSVEVTKVLKPSLAYGLDCEELDIGKYDKSQGALALMVECELMRRFGIATDVVDMWFYQHVRSTYHNHAAGVTGYVNFQRRSGDAATFLGNTMFLMAVVADCMRVEECSLSMFSGDDSLLLGKGITNAISEERMASVYNLQVKRMSYKYYYFCSKFLIPDFVRDKWDFVFDPVKLVVKLGRSDLRNEKHVEEYRVSVLDTVKELNHENISILALAVIDRYGIDLDVSAALRVLCAIPRNAEDFATLYYPHPTLPLCSDPSLPDLEF